MSAVRLLVIIGAVLAALLVATPAALACAVCFGDKNHPMTQGAASGVLFMVVFTYALLVFGFGGAVTFWMIRARRLQRRDNPPGTP